MAQLFPHNRGSGAAPRVSICGLCYTASYGPHLVSIIITVGLLAIALVINGAYSPRDLLADDRLNPFHVAHYGIFDSGGQRLAHRVLLAGLLITFLLFRRYPDALKRAQTVWSDLIWLRASMVTILVGFGLLVLAWQMHTVGSKVTVAGIFSLVVAYYLSRRIRGRIASRGFALLTLVIVLGVTVPGFFLPEDLSGFSPDELVAFQAHYSYATSAGDRLAYGQTLFDPVSPSLGVLLPVIFGAWQRHFGLIDMGQYLEIFRWFELMFLLLALVLFHVYARRRYHLVLLGVLLIVPWHHFNHPSLVYPNQSAWRAMGFAIAPAGIYWVRNLTVQKMVFVLALLGSLLVVFNPETGFALSMGFIVFVLTRFYARQGPSLPVIARLAGIALAAVGIVATSLLLLYRIGLGGWPNLASLDRSLHTFISFATGYGGYKASFDPLALLIAGHATYVLLWSASSGRTWLSFRQSFRAALATSIVVWFGYYANRAAAWNLWTLVFLYSFISIDLLNFLVRRFTQLRRLAPGVAFACLALGAVIFPHLVATNRGAFWQMWSGIHRLGDTPPSAAVYTSGVYLSGVYLAKETADELSRKALYLREKDSLDQSGAGPVVYLSASSYLISKLTRIYSPLPFSDPFNDVYTRRDYQALIDAIATAHPKEIYFDAADNILGGDHHYRQYFRKLREDLAPFYETAGAAMGWEVLRRKN